MSNELDYEVCQKVLGWTKHLRKDNFPIHKPEGWLPPKEYEFEDYYWSWVPPDFKGDVAYSRARPKPSTSIQDAWMVVEKMREKYRRVEVHALGTKHELKGYCCMIEDGFDTIDENYIVDASEETAPLAICRAALLAVGRE